MVKYSNEKEEGENIMTRVNYDEAMKDQLVEIADKYLVVDTNQSGYFNIFKGVHPFKVIKNVDGDYAVYPVMWVTDGVGNVKLTNEPYPIIRSIEDDVFFVKRTLNDPYNGPSLGNILGKNDKRKVEHKVIDAFNAFAHDEFNLGQPNPIHIFLKQEITKTGDGYESPVNIQEEGEEVIFELRDLKGEIVMETPEDSNGETGQE